MPFTVIVVFYTCGIYSKYKVLAEQDKFDEESQIEAVTIEDAGTEDATTVDNVWRIVANGYNYANTDNNVYCLLNQNDVESWFLNPLTKILFNTYFLFRIVAMTFSIEEVGKRQRVSEVSALGSCKNPRPRTILKSITKFDRSHRLDKET